jgi:hypothetical protein
LGVISSGVDDLILFLDPSLEVAGERRLVVFVPYLKRVFKLAGRAWYSVAVYSVGDIAL